MKFTYTPRGVCSRKIEIELDDGGLIQQVRFQGGCHGNAQGIAALVQGRPAEEVMGRLAGISCMGKGTSCPDQLARALAQALSSRKG